MASTNPTPSLGRGSEPGGISTVSFSTLSLRLRLSLSPGLSLSLGARGVPVPVPLRFRVDRRFVPPSGGGATSAHASCSVPAAAEDALAAEGKSRASSDAALPCSIGASISCAVREGETGPCPFTLDVLVSWPLLFIGGVLLRFAGLAPRVRRTFPGEPGSGIDSERFARSGKFSIVVAVLTVGSFSGRYGELLSRPENNAIAGNSRELADELQDRFDQRLIRAKKRTC